MMLALVLLLASDSADARRVRIIARALSYEQNLRERATNIVQVLLVSRPGADECTGIYQEFMKLGGVRVQGIPMEIRQRTLATTDAIVAEMKAMPTHVLYVCDSSTDAIGPLTAQTRKMHVLSVGSGKKQVSAGASLGVEIEGEKITLLVNRTAAKAEGANFSDQLLKVATVID